MSNETLFLRKRELARRIENIPAEVAAWRAATQTQLDLNAHFSQLEAIETLTNAIVDEQRAQIKDLDPAGDTDAFQQHSFNLIKSLTRAQKAWDFFRDKLDLRYSPNHKKELWTADTIAWDCHRPVMNRAVQFGIVASSQQLREPPLTYCTAQYSPATWVRGSRPNDGRVYDLGEVLLPIPVIEMPWDHLGNAWEYLSLHHEVGHDIEADLKVRGELRNSLQNTLLQAGVEQSRVKIWLKWEGEVFADLCALRLAGPAFADALLQLLLLPSNAVKLFNEDDPHPTPYLRIFLNTAYIRTLGNSQKITDHATAIENQWKSIYGDDYADDELKGLSEDFSLVFDALMNTNFAALNGKKVAELIPFGDAEDGLIRSSERFFRTGMNRPNGLPLRHTVSAARLAIGTAAKDGSLTEELCGEIHERVIGYVEETAPPGLRGGGADEHKNFIASFAARMFPL